MVNFKKYLIIFLALFVAFLVVYQPVFHNHQPDFRDHESCPSTLLAILFSVDSFLFIKVFVLFLFVFFDLLFTPTFQRCSFFIPLLNYKRGPPAYCDVL